jgi:hypothetical protein
MTLQALFDILTGSISEAVKQAAPDGRIRPADIGLICVSSAAGLAVALGCSREQLEANWREVMRCLDSDARAETQRSAFHLVGPDGKPLEKP